MAVTRRLALWGACVSVATAQHYDDTRDGLWHVCSPAWAVPQLDDDSLTADEAWRVEKYLARAACSSQTPIICQICAGLAARADGASNAPGTCGLKQGEQPFDSLLLQTTGQVAACAQATDGKLHAYYSELSCLLEAYSRATPLVVLPPSLRWGFRFGDTTRAMEGAYLIRERARARSKSSWRVGGVRAARRHGRAARLPPGARVRAAGVRRWGPLL